MPRKVLKATASEHELVSDSLSELLVFMLMFFCTFAVVLGEMNAQTSVENPQAAQLEPQKELERTLPMIANWETLDSCFLEDDNTTKTALKVTVLEKGFQFNKKDKFYPNDVDGFSEVVYDYNGNTIMGYDGKSLYNMARLTKWGLANKGNQPCKIMLLFQGGSIGATIGSANGAEKVENEAKLLFAINFLTNFFGFYTRDNGKIPYRYNGSKLTVPSLMDQHKAYVEAYVSDLLHEVKDQIDKTQQALAEPTINIHRRLRLEDELSSNQQVQALLGQTRDTMLKKLSPAQKLPGQRI